MIETIYIEKKIINHPRTKFILSKFKNARHIEINRFGEIFNKRNQNFRIQKNNPDLILAFKNDSHVLPAPEGFGIGSSRNYYFSHMYNCIYDCRYCFLQGMYSSANYVVFVNFEDFETSLKKIIKENEVYTCVNEEIIKMSIYLNKSLKVIINRLLAFNFPTLRVTTFPLILN